MRIIQAFLVFLVASACSEDAMPPLVASDVQVTAPMPGMSMSAGYVSITNNTDSAIRITRVDSPNYESVEMHESVLEDGIAKMHQLHELTIPPNSTIALQRGGKHLMLMRPSGNSVQVSLNFFDEETLLLGVTTTPLKRNN